MALQKLGIYFAFLSISLAFSFEPVFAATFKGNIVVWNALGETVRRVPLPLVRDGKLQDEFVSFSETPSDLLPDSEGCFCFGANDDRLAWVQTYVVASEQIQFYNQLFRRTGLPELRGVVLSLGKGGNDSEPGGATSSKTDVILHFDRPAFDPTIIAHEIGHAIHLHLLGKGVGELIQFPPKDWNILAAQSGILEGTANLLAALFLGESQIGKYSWFDAAIEINAFVDLKGRVPSLQDHFERKVHSVIYASHYPKTVELLTEWLKNPLMPEAMDKADPYLASAAINQPLWSRSLSEGNVAVLMDYIQAIAELKEFQSYADLANKLLEVSARTSSDRCEYLYGKYRERGISVEHSLCQTLRLGRL